MWKCTRTNRIATMRIIVQVDEFFGSDAKKLRDHTWLHAPMR